MNRGSRTIVPGLRLGRWGPWALGGTAAALAAIGLVRGDGGMVLLGALGLGAAVLAFPVAHRILGSEMGDGDAGDAG